jgi:alkylation response protein AidB-like acyl-CoA dehydrogenase
VDTTDPEEELFRARCRSWLAEEAPTSGPAGATRSPDDVAVFHSLTFEDEQALIRRCRDWQRVKYAAGFGSIRRSGDPDTAGLLPRFASIFAEEEAKIASIETHEVVRVTVSLIAEAVRACGTPEQMARFVEPFLRGDELCCQLFSEPGAGSDLAGLSTRALLDGDEWLVNGSKVWVSGAQFADWGALLARTDVTAGKHAGLTMFLLPMFAPGVDVRPIKQMSGGASFNEVFLTDVRVHDSLRLDAVGEGWSVTKLILGLERNGGAGRSKVGGSWEQLRALATSTQRIDDPIIRQQLARVYTQRCLREWSELRARARYVNTGRAGPEGSIGKLLWVQGLQQISEVVGSILGPRLIAETGEAGTYAWHEHVLGAPGFRIAGGSDEIQRNIIAERVLGLPRDPSPSSV